MKFNKNLLSFRPGNSGFPQSKTDLFNVYKVFNTKKKKNKQKPPLTLKKALKFLKIETFSLALRWLRVSKTKAQQFLFKGTTIRIHFHLIENASKLLRPFERFCVVFACPQDNAENYVSRVLSTLGGAGRPRPALTPKWTLPPGTRKVSNT